MLLSNFYTNISEFPAKTSRDQAQTKQGKSSQLAPHHAEHQASTFDLNWKTFATKSISAVAMPRIFKGHFVTSSAFLEGQPSPPFSLATVWKKAKTTDLSQWSCWIRWRKWPGVLVIFISYHMIAICVFRESIFSIKWFIGFRPHKYKETSSIGTSLWHGMPRQWFHVSF